MHDLFAASRHPLMHTKHPASNLKHLARRHLIWRANQQAFDPAGENMARGCRATGSATLEAVTTLWLLWGGAGARNSTSARWQPEQLRYNTWFYIGLQNLNKKKKSTITPETNWQDGLLVCNTAVHRLSASAGTDEAVDTSKLKVHTFKVPNTLQVFNPKICLY